MIYLYILKGERSDNYYVGISKNIQDRIKRHNSGDTCSTKGRGPWTLIYQEEYNSYEEARIREVEVKAYKGGNSFKKLVSKN